MIRDSAGNLYGTTEFGGITSGSFEYGVVYKLDTNGKEIVLYSFSGRADGGTPSGVKRDLAGNLYGTTQTGGASSVGVVFKLTP